MHVGWIKLHRKFLEWEWFDNEKMVKLFIYLLLTANHQDNKWFGIDVKRGQLITGISKLSKNTKLSEQSIRTCIKRLKSTGEITSKTTNRYSIITICNYDSYQSLTEETNKLNNNLANKQLTNKQQATNYKQELKKDNNNKKKKKCLFRNAKITIQDIENAFKETNDIRLADAEYYFNAVKDWSDAKNEMRIDWIATARSFARKDTKDGKLKIRKIRQEYKKDPEQERIGEGKPLHEIIDKLKIGQ